MRNPLSWLPIASGMLVLVLSLGLAYVTVSSRNANNGELATSQDVRTEASSTAPTLSLSPSSGNFDFQSGQTYPVGIVIDSAGKSIDGVDVVISYDPSKVQIIGGKVNSSSLLPEVPLNTADSVKGKIRFSALTFDPKAVTGIVGTFSFKPLSKGEVNFAFEFTNGATTDSNVAEHGSAIDVLTGVENATYMFN